MEKGSYINFFAQPSRASVTWLIAAIIFAVGFLIYSNTLDVPFYFDDAQNIRDNKAIHLSSLSVETLALAVKKSSNPNRPLANLSFALNYYVHQDQLAGYHLVNIAVHLSAAFFLYLLLATTFALPGARVVGNPRLIAFLGAMLWLANPVQTQAVTYIVQRMTSLSGMFYLLSLYCYARGRIGQQEERHWRGWFVAMVLAGLLALSAKENAVTLPFFIYLYEFYFFRNLDWDWFKKSIPWLGLALMILAVAGYIFTNGHPLQAILNSFHYRDFSLVERLLTESRIIFFYLTLLFFPHPSRLNLDHDFSISQGLLEPFSTLPAIAALVGLFVLAIALARRERLLSFAILWFGGNLFLESSFVGLELIFEHRLYIPSAFLLALLPVMLFRFVKLQTVMIAILSIVIALSCYWTYQRNHTWREPLRFLQDIADKAPTNYRPHYNLGFEFKKKGKFAEAIPEFTKALELEPRLLMAHSELAFAYSQINRLDLALHHYQKVLAITPNDPAVLYAVGYVYSQYGNLPQATLYFEKALRAAPGDPMLMLNLGTLLHKQGDTTGALELYRKSLAIDPGNAQTWHHISIVFLDRKQYELAEKYAGKALEINPNYIKAQRTLAEINRLRSTYP